MGNKWRDNSKQMLDQDVSNWINYTFKKSEINELQRIVKIDCDVKELL